MGTIISFAVFILILPSWVEIRWKKHSFLQVIGFTGASPRQQLIFFTKGILWAILLVAMILVPILLGSWGKWIGLLSHEILLNGLLLGIGVGIAEEIIFRAWLWGELNQLVGSRWGLIGQAAVFSLVHVRFDLGLVSMLGLFLGLFLLGFSLALRRRLDQKSLWGCVGFHGGLVGGWFLVNAELIQLSPSAPQWLVGTGILTPNPLGGLVGIFLMMIIVWHQLTALPIAR